MCQDSCIYLYTYTEIDKYSYMPWVFLSDLFGYHLPLVEQRRMIEVRLKLLEIVRRACREFVMLYSSNLVSFIDVYPCRWCMRWKSHIVRELILRDSCKHCEFVTTVTKSWCENSHIQNLRVYKSRHGCSECEFSDIPTCATDLCDVMRNW